MKGKKSADVVTRLLNLGSGVVSACASLLAVVLILYSGYVLYDSLATEISAFSSSNDLLKYKPRMMASANDDGPSLAEINPDYRGWITVDGTPIDYPIVQGNDDLYYASHDANREVSLTGAIYLAAENSPDFSDSYNLLYGHHMDNGAMFGSLDRYKDADYFQSHQTAVLKTKEGKVYDVTFFAVASTDAYEKQIYTVGNRAGEVISFLTGSREGDAGIGTTVLNYDPEAAEGAYKVLALSTCASADTNGRLVVFGRMKLRKEEPTTPPPTTAEPDETTPAPTTPEPPTPTPTRGGGGTTPTPTPTVTPVQPVQLTVQFVSGGTQVFPTQVYTYMPGSPYYVVAPQLPGYTVDIEIVQGTIHEDMVVIIHYTPIYNTLVIHYIYPNGTQAAPDYTTLLRYGQEYDVASPDVPGYRPVILIVSGRSQGTNIEHTVVYLPEDWGPGDLPVPLGLETTQMQVGICFE